MQNRVLADGTGGLKPGLDPRRNRPLDEPRLATFRLEQLAPLGNFVAVQPGLRRCKTVAVLDGFFLRPSALRGGAAFLRQIPFPCDLHLRQHLDQQGVALHLAALFHPGHGLRAPRKLRQRLGKIITARRQHLGGDRITLVEQLPRLPDLVGNGGDVTNDLDFAIRLDRNDRVHVRFSARFDRARWQSQYPAPGAIRAAQ